MEKEDWEGYERVEGFLASTAGMASDIGGAIETSPLFLVKRIRAFIAGASPDIMLIAYRSSIFMPPPVGGRRAIREGREMRRRGSKSLATVAREERIYAISIESLNESNSQSDLIKR